MCYVTPGQDMIVRPGQHVDVQGKIYHPFLRDWAGMQDQASLVGLVGILQQVFAKEPPVISKAQQQQYQRSLDSRQPPMNTTMGAPPPPPPPKQLPDTVAAAGMSTTSTPPPRPPKPGDEGTHMLQRASPRDVSRDGPPLPPLPGERPRSQAYTPGAQYSNGFATPPRPPSGAPGAQQQPFGLQEGRPTGPPGQPPPHQYQHHLNTPGESPVSPLPPTHRYSQAPSTNFAPPPHAAQHVQYLSHQRPPQKTSLPPQQQPQHIHSYQSGYQPQQQPQQQHEPQHYMQTRQYPLPVQGQQPVPLKKQPPPDLLSDPFDVALPTSSMSNGSTPAPPIPPNPEKEHLLQALSSALVQQAQQKVDQNLSALAPLQAQQSAMRAAQARLESELQQLDHLDKTLTSNEQILHRSIQDCDKTIQQAKQKKQPPIDEVLVAPTMVANQLWTLCAEEAACREAMYILQKAVDKGRIGGADFARQMRGLGRECFLKMALARKCASGMGLELGRR